MLDKKITLAKKVLKLRLAQKVINEHYKSGAFKIPIHLAMGHESIAVAVDSVMQSGDQLLCTHRNIHYNFLKILSIKDLLNQYLLIESKTSEVMRGSMNLDNHESGIIYTSSILGNNLNVGAGVALAQKIKGQGQVPFIVTGDGAMEEGAFYESLLFMRSVHCPAVIILENNEWSLATSIKERRYPISAKDLVNSLQIEYEYLSGNDVAQYTDLISEVRRRTLETKKPIVVEVGLTTLGHWTLVNEDYKNGKYVNYHAGPAMKIEIQEPFLIEKNNHDPIHVIQSWFQPEEWNQLQNAVLDEVKIEGVL